MRRGGRFGLLCAPPSRVTVFRQISVTWATSFDDLRDDFVWYGDTVFNFSVWGSLNREGLSEVVRTGFHCAINSRPLTPCTYL